MRRGLLVLAFSLFVGSVASAKSVGPGEGLASDVIEMSGVARGLCSVIGCEDGGLALALARSGDHVVHVWEPASSAVDALNKAADEAGVSSKQLVVDRGELGALPYATNTVDFIVAANLTKGELKALKRSEALRAVRPGGKVIVGRTGILAMPADAATDGEIKAWAGEGLNVAQPDRAPDFWAVITKPLLEGVDDWSHWEHGPDNNPVSTDEVIKAPYMTQWLAEPYYIAMPAISTASGGRVFIAMGHIAHHVREEPWLNTLIARNGYNGTVLWTRKLPDGYLAHRSAFVATPDTFYMIDVSGSGCVMLDAETGVEKGRVEVPEVRGEWKWMAIKDGVLYALAGKQKDPPETTIVRSENPHWSWGELSQGYYPERVPWGFGTTLLAYDLKAKKVLWTHEEDEPIDSRAMVIGGDRMYFYGPDSHVGSLDITCGDVKWTNNDPQLRKLVEQKGQGLGSTPGFRSMCYAVWTPQALFFEAQTRAHIVAVSLKDGSIMWHRAKTTNNPNVLYLDGRVLVGIGPDGMTLALDPMTGNTLEDLGFKKRSCARLTAAPDSLFCRGWREGVTRYDRATKKVLYNGAFRPSCNDGIIPANGLLYAGPWACDCNLALMGRIALCGAGDFAFEREAVEADRLEVGTDDLQRVAAFEVSEGDWPTYRADSDRSGASPASVASWTIKVWEYQAGNDFVPTAPVSAGGLVFIGGDDGKVRAIDSVTGGLKWTFVTGGPVMRPPTIWNRRAYVGSGDGYVYALEAASGRLLWRFRAAPVERRTMIYGSLCSTWPVNTGVLVEDGVAYAAAGIIDYDGTYVYALDAITGKLKWQNVSSGHLDKELRKGVSAQGTLTVAGGRLWMPGGNIVSPVAYDLKTGAYAGRGVGDGSPQANRGEEIGLIRGRYVVYGGRLQYSARDNVVNSDRFDVVAAEGGAETGEAVQLTSGRIPPVWNDDRLVMMQGKDSVPVCCAMGDVETYLAKRDSNNPPKQTWKADYLKERDTVSLAMAGNAVVGVNWQREPWRKVNPRWRVLCMDASNGQGMWEHVLPSPARVGGLLVDRDGRVVVALENGDVVCYGGTEVVADFVSGVMKAADDSAVGRQKAVQMLLAALRLEKRPEIRRELVDRLKELEYVLGTEAKRDGWLADWYLSDPVPFDGKENPVDKVFVGEPDVDVSQKFVVDGRELGWRKYTADDPRGEIDCIQIYGWLSNVANYACSEFHLPEAQSLLLKVGSDDGYKCWFNGKEVGAWQGRRGYRPEDDVLCVEGVKGINKVLLKVTQHDGGWGLGARVTTPTNDPIDLTRGE